MGKLIKQEEDCDVCNLVIPTYYFLFCFLTDQYYVWFYSLFVYFILERLILVPCDLSIRKVINTCSCDFKDESNYTLGDFTSKLRST